MNKNMVSKLPNFQGTAKGGQQKEFDQIFSFLGLFWSLFLMLLSLVGHFFVKLLLPDSFRGRMTFVLF